MLQNNRAEAGAYWKKEETQKSASVTRLVENSVIAAWTSIHGNTTCFSLLGNISSHILFVTTLTAISCISVID